MAALNKTMLPIDGSNEGARVEYSKASGLGFVRIDSGNSLSDIAKAFPTGGNADYAIPSVIAHIKNFKKKLDDGEEKYVNEWRGMLAAIAMRGCLGLDISIKPVELNSPSSTMLQKVIYEELSEYKDANWPTNDDTNGNLYIFYKDGNPFAMLIPGMLICPFKSYPKTLFNGLQWYKSKDSIPSWIPVEENIEITTGELSIQAQELYCYLDSLREHFSYNRITEFRDSIINRAKKGESDSNNLPKGYLPVNPLTSSGKYTETSGFKALVSQCPPPEHAPKKPFSDKVLVIIPQKNIYDEAEHKIDYGPSRLTPKRCSGIGIGDKYGYILPPVSNEVIKSLINGAQINDFEIRFDGKEIFCGFKLRFNEGMTIPYSNSYPATKIVYAADMPYISLWPNIDESIIWNEYLIGIVKHNPTEGLKNDADLKDYTSLIDLPGVKRITGTYENSGASSESHPELNISMISDKSAKTYDYSCHSAYKNRYFKIFRSDIRPYAIEFKYTDAGKNYSLGCWVIPSDNAKNYNGARGVKCDIGIDFGTTSTNVYVRRDDNKTARSIYSPGRYIMDIFNPYIQKTDGNIENAGAEAIQKYYLFGSEKGYLGKIFSFGQNLEAETNNGVASNIVNVTGRYVSVDESYLENAEEFGSGGIFYPLKWPNLGSGKRLCDSARSHFLAHLLKCALLDAQVHGNDAVAIHFSYPLPQIRKIIEEDINGIADKLEEISGYRIRGNIYFSTEAFAAGCYYINRPGEGSEKIAPSSGYAIVDIGGGTTDISVWFDNTGGENAELIGQASYKFAGNEIIRRSIIRTISDLKKFKDMWSQEDNGKKYNLIEKYKGLSGKLGIGEATDEYETEAAKLDFILEHYKLNRDIVECAPYDSLTSAVQIKYYALFYAVAKWIKRIVDDENNPLSITVPNTFSICLAGCGSKGLSISRDSSFISNISSIFNRVLSVSVNFVQSAENDKKEVAAGLTYIPTLRNPNAKVHNDGFQIKEDQSKTSLSDEKLIAEVIKFFNIIENFCLADDLFERIAASRYSDSSDAKNVLNQIIPKIRGQVLTLIKNGKCDPEIAEDLIVLKVVDALIDYFA